MQATAGELDILEMPAEALAAYWLSLKKLLDAKRDKNLLLQEQENTSERFIRHLLESCVSSLPEELLRRMARAKAQALTAETARRLEMIRQGVGALCQGENPRLSFIRLSCLGGLVGQPGLGAPTGGALDEKRAFDLAQGLMTALAEPDANPPALLVVDHKQKEDRLAVKLLFYSLAARKHGRQSLHEYLPHLAPGYFAEGLALAADGFDAAFALKHMGALRDAMLAATRRKMRMATELCLAIRGQLSYEDVFRVARAYMA